MTIGIEELSNGAESVIRSLEAQDGVNLDWPMFSNQLSLMITFTPICHITIW